RATPTTVITCSGTGTPAAIATAPVAAPRTVPMENPPWKAGITARPSAFSARAPARFIATAQPPMPMVVTNSPPPRMSGGPTATPVTATANPAVARQAAISTVRRAPRRVRMRPVSGMARMDPREPIRMISPNSLCARFSSSRMVGMRASQLAKVKPLSTKVAKTAMTARRARVCDMLTPVVAGSGLPNVFSACAGSPACADSGFSCVRGLSVQAHARLRLAQHLAPLDRDGQVDPGGIVLDGPDLGGDLHLDGSRIGHRHRPGEAHAVAEQVAGVG